MLWPTMAFEFPCNTLTIYGQVQLAIDWRIVRVLLELTIVLLMVTGFGVGYSTVSLLFFSTGLRNRSWGEKRLHHSQLPWPIPATAAVSRQQSHASRISKAIPHHQQPTESQRGEEIVRGRRRQGQTSWHPSTQYCTREGILPHRRQWPHPIIPLCLPLRWQLIHHMTNPLWRHLPQVNPCLPI